MDLKLYLPLFFFQFWIVGQPLASKIKKNRKAFIIYVCHTFYTIVIEMGIISWIVVMKKKAQIEIHRLLVKKLQALKDIRSIKGWGTIMSDKGITVCRKIVCPGLCGGCRVIGIPTAEASPVRMLSAMMAYSSPKREGV